MSDPRYEAQFDRDFHRAQAEYENQVPEDVETEDDIPDGEEEEKE